MLPNRKSTPPPPRRESLAAEVRIPGHGVRFVALVASVRPAGVLLWTDHEIESSTEVIVELELPFGRVVLDGAVTESHVKSGLAITFGHVPSEVVAELLLLSIPPAALRVA